MRKPSCQAHPVHTVYIVKWKLLLHDMLITLCILALTYFSNISLYNSSTCFLRSCVPEFLLFTEYFTAMLLVQSLHLWWCGVFLSPSSKLLVSFQIQLHYWLPQHLHTWGNNCSIIALSYLRISKFFVFCSLCLRTILCFILRLSDMMLRHLCGYMSPLYK